MKIYLNGDAISNLAQKLAQLQQRAKPAINEMLMNGSDFLIEALKRGCESYGHVNTGGLRESIDRKSPPKVTDDGGEVIVTFKGTNEHGVRYGEIMAYLNYGTAGGKIQADHWVDNTVAEAMPIATQIMNDTLNKYLNA